MTAEACMQEAGFPDINIICEKVAAEGETRFEDRYRLPIGISVNMTSFSAKLLTSAIYNPRNIMVFSQVGVTGRLTAHLLQWIGVVFECMFEALLMCHEELKGKNKAER